MKLALVTGASGALGKEIARLLSERGFATLTPTRTQMDVASVNDVISWMRYPIQQFQRFDVIVNCAAILSDDLEDSLWTNALGAYNVTRFAWPHLAPGARVINISSRESLVASFGNRPYSISKATLNAITRMQAVNPDGVIVNACCPGWFRSRLGGEKAPKSASEAADTPVWLATEAPANLSGLFFIDRQIVPW